MWLRLFLIVTLTTAAACGDDDDSGGDPRDADVSGDGSAGSIDGGDLADAAPADAAAGALSCAASDGCEVGPPCGDKCCGDGEACVDGECRCGEQKACKVDQTCERPGPTGEDTCGTICCGPGGPPCPD